MAACDVFVLASAWEGLPGRRDGGAALGLPIVATAVGGVAEQFGAADAVLVPPRDPAALADALEAVLLDPRRRSELSAASRSAATRFDVRRAMDTLTARYEQLAGAPASPPRPPVAPPRRRRRLGRASGDGRRPGADPRAARRVARLERRPRYASCSRGSTNATRSGRRSAGWSRRGGRVVAVRLFMRWEFRRGGDHAARSPRRRHGDAPGPPGPWPVHGTDTARPRGVPRRRRGVRVQHAERPEPARLPQARLA